MLMRAGSHIFTRLSTNGMSHPAFTPPPQCITALWPVLSSRSTESRRLSWPEWLVTYGDGMPAESSDVLVEADHPQMSCLEAASKAQLI